MDDLVQRLRDTTSWVADDDFELFGLAADRIVALGAERDRLRGEVTHWHDIATRAADGRDRLAADNARLREREVELLEFIGEPVTLADLRASFDAARPYLDAYLRPGRAAGSTDSSTP